MPPSSEMRRKLVVAGLISRQDGCVLLSQRRPDQDLALKWELPGGKVEIGESPEDALRRELHEELGVAARVGRIWDVMYHVYPDYEVVMLVYHCRLEHGQIPTCREVNQVAWVPRHQLPSYDVLAADKPLVDRLIAGD
jgi:8-oxo-dGTP diphosphatase